jgi:hypothetical protein
MKIRLIAFIAAALLLFNACKKDKSTPAPTSTNNKYDGKYRMEGTLTDHHDGSFVWPGNTYLYNLVTTSPTQIKLVSIDLGIDGHLLKNGINLTFYGTFGLLVNFDPATNKITSVTNSYGQPSANGRSAVLDPSGINTWDPVTKTVKIKYWMDEVGIVGVGGHRTSFDETWIYVGAR